MSNRQISSAQPAQDELDLMQLVALAWRGKWIIALCIFVCLAASVVYVREIAVPRYQATSKILISQRSAQVIDFESVVSGVSKDAAAINTELEIIRSPAMIEKLVTDLELYADPEFNPYLREVSPWSARGISDRLSALVSSASQDRPEQTQDQAIQTAMNMVSRSIYLQAQPQTHLFNIHITTEDRKKSARIANRLANLYIEQQVGLKFEAVGYAVDWLSERVIELRDELRDREEQIKNVRIDGRALTAQDLEGMTLQLRSLESRSASADAALQAARDRLETANALRSSGDIEDLLQFFDDPLLRRTVNNAGSNPAQNAAAQQQILGLIERAETEMVRQQAQRDALSASLAKLREEVDAASQKFTQLNTLVREAESTRTLLETFSARLKETSLQAGLQRADSQLISPARNSFQVEPRTKRIYSLAIVFGILVGVIVVLGRQFLQNGFRSSSEIEHSTGVPVIGQVPLIPIKRRDQLIPYLLDKPTSAAVESIRNLRTSIMMANSEEPPQVIMITSSIPAEGKTTLSIALAMNFASLGRKVLFVEGDIRRRTLNNYFQVQSSHGLLDAIYGDQPLADVVTHEDNLKIDLLMGQETKTNAADLFASHEFGAFMRTAREHYDHIIIDTPPVLVVPDARLIARHCDSVTYVVRWNSTDRSHVTDGLHQLQTVGIDVTGMVLSRVDPAGMKRYGYGNRYGAYSNYGMSYYSN